MMVSISRKNRQQLLFVNKAEKNIKRNISFEAIIRRNHIKQMKSHTVELSINISQKQKIK